MHLNTNKFKNHFVYAYYVKIKKIRRLDISTDDKNCSTQNINALKQLL